MYHASIRRIAVAPLLLAAAPVLAAVFAGVEVPPPPAPRVVTDTYWGVQVEDPYRFLEDTASPEVQAYMKAQAEATQAILAKLPGRDRLLARIKEIDSEVPAVVTSVRRDERGGIFYKKREAGANQFKLYRRDGPAGPEKLVFDPEVEARATGKPHAIGDYAPSDDGRLVALQVSAGGTEIGTLRVLDVATGKEVMPRIDRIRGGSPTWLPDGSGLFYTRLAEGYEKRPRAERFMDELTYLRRLDAPGKDVAVFGPGLHPEVSIERSAGAVVGIVADQPVAFALVFHGVDPNRSLYFAEAKGVLEGRPAWRKVFDQSAQVQDLADTGGYLYLKTARDAPRFKLLRVALPAAELARAETIIPAGTDVITDIGGAREGLYVVRRDGPAKRLARISKNGGVQPIALPIEGDVGVTASPRLPGAILAISGWTRATRHWSLGPADERPSPLALAPPGRYDAPAGVVAREVKVRSHDGVEVPLSIISGADVKLDGSNPVMLYGYAAYGIVEDPSLTPRTVAWLEQGGVLAIVHARGGGIYGDAWHRAGQKTTKSNTWKDGIAAAEWLVANGYTTPKRLFIYGGSAGGIFVGRALLERPDLFAAAAIGVGNTDQVRSEFRANGAGNIPEYGTVKKEDEFRALLANSTYANVKPGSKLPAVIFEHGVNDSRVDVWMTTKTATRMAAATASGKPILMRLEYDSGHGVGSTLSQAQQRIADRWAFFLWQAGHPDFQPVNR
jgi:prolyl oligopeptidase